jgi:hypothetical protein
VISDVASLSTLLLYKIIITMKTLNSYDSRYVLRFNYIFAQRISSFKPIITLLNGCKVKKKVKLSLCLTN